MSSERRMWQNQYSLLSDYNGTMQFVEGCAIVTVKYPAEWQSVSPNTPSVEMRKRGDTTYYCAPQGDSTDEIFETIKRTVGVNHILQEKSNLLQEKMKELYDLFEREDLAVLKKLEFRIPTPKKPKKAPSRRDAITQPSMDSSNDKAEALKETA